VWKNHRFVRNTDVPKFGYSNTADDDTKHPVFTAPLPVPVFLVYDYILAELNYSDVN